MDTETPIALQTLDGRTLHGSVRRNGQVVLRLDQNPPDSTVTPDDEDVNPERDIVWRSVDLLRNAVRDKIIELQNSEEWCGPGTDEALVELGMPRIGREDESVRVFIDLVHAVVRRRQAAGFPCRQIFIALTELGIPITQESTVPQPDPRRSVVTVADEEAVEQRDANSGETGGARNFGGIGVQLTAGLTIAEAISRLQLLPPDSPLTSDLVVRATPVSAANGAFFGYLPQDLQATRQATPR